MAPNTITATYNGPSGRRTFTKDDGFTATLVFERGVPVEVSRKDADRLAETGEFELAEGPRGSADKPDTEA